MSHPLDPSTSVSRGDGWHTLQHRYLSTETDARGDRLLIEKNVLVRPGQPDVTVERVFERRGDELRGNAQPPAHAPCAVAVVPKLSAFVANNEFASFDVCT